MIGHIFYKADYLVNKRVQTKGQKDVSRTLSSLLYHIPGLTESSSDLEIKNNIFKTIKF